MRFRIAQCLCPQRHAIFGFAVNDPSLSDDTVLALLKAGVQAALDGHALEIDAPVSKINPWCGLCGAKRETWSYEVKLSKDFPSWDEAQEALKLVAQRQQHTKDLLDSLGLSFDARQRKRQASQN